jgi:60 kDa SS-A/Ro ribonucleoprotein
MNKNQFRSAKPKDLTRNLAGGVAFGMSQEAALSQYVLTGCFNATFYADAEEDLARVAQLAADVDPKFLARLAAYGRERGYMKDAPALLLAVLSVREPALFARVFDRVVDNGKMLRNFVQVIRSGVAGRKSLGTGPKTRVAHWLNRASVRQLLSASVGNDPSLADVIKLARPKATSKSREALYGYFIGKKIDAALLPDEVQALEAFRADPAGSAVPDVEFRLIDRLLTNEQWKDVARNASWQMTRMNLNTFARHDVFTDETLVQLIARRLAAAEEIKRARAFPYQLLAAYRNASDEVPRAVREALHDALEVAVDNVPSFEGRVAVFPDVSGSMSSAVTGYRRGSTSAVRCIDVAALVAATVLRKNPDAIVLPFENDVVEGLKLEPRDTIMTNAQKLAAVGGGGTNCSAPLARMIERKLHADLVIYVSDNESWIDSSRAARSTATQQAWERFKQANPDAKLVCIDIAPNATTQARTAADVLNVGGFSDAVFDVVAAFARGELGADALLKRVQAVKVD